MNGNNLILGVKGETARMQLERKKERCSNVERQNILAKYPEKSWLTLYRDTQNAVQEKKGVE